MHLPPRSKILDPPLATATVLGAASMSAPSLGRRLEAAPVTVTSAAAAAGCCFGRLPAQRTPESLKPSQTDSKKVWHRPSLS